MAVELVHFVALLVLKRVVRGTMRRLPFTLSPSEPLSSTDPGSFSRSSFTHALALNKGFGSSYLPFFHTSCLSHSRLPHSHARFFHTSMFHENGSFLLVPYGQPRFIKAMVSDYAQVVDDIEEKKRNLDKKKKKIFRVKDHRMVKIFGLPLEAPNKILEGRRLKFRKIISSKNAEFHATYDAEEAQTLITFCENPENKAFMEAENLTVADVHELIQDLNNIREEINTNYKIEDGRKEEVPKEQKLNEETDVS